MLKIVQNQESQRADSRSTSRQSVEDRGEVSSPSSHKSSRIQSPAASVKSPTFSEASTIKSSIYNRNQSPMSMYSDAIASKKNNRLNTENRFSPEGHSDPMPSSTFTPNSSHRSRTPSDQDKRVIMSPPQGMDQPLYIQTDTRDHQSVTEMEGLVSTTGETDRKPDQGPPINREPEKAMQVNSPSSTSGKH